jgi:hypothetical protein
MFYKLLGMAAWNGARWYLGRRYGSKSPAKALALGGALALGAGVVALVARRGGAER